MSYVRIALWLMYVCRALLKSLVPAYMYVNRGFHRLPVRKLWVWKRKCCLKKSPGKASNFPPSKTLFEPCSSFGHYFPFLRVSAQESVNCNYLRDLGWRLRQTVNVRFKLTISQIWKWEGKNCPKSFLLMNLSGIKLLILESFRFEGKCKCEI